MLPIQTSQVYEKRIQKWLKADWNELELYSAGKKGKQLRKRCQSFALKIRCISFRVTGLLEAGAMKPNDKPIWYNVYAAFPPKLEPRFDRPVQNVPVRNIFYEEDICRA